MLKALQWRIAQEGTHPSCFSDFGQTLFANTSWRALAANHIYRQIESKSMMTNTMAVALMSSCPLNSEISNKRGIPAGMIFRSPVLSKNRPHTANVQAAASTDKRGFHEQQLRLGTDQ